MTLRWFLLLLFVIDAHADWPSFRGPKGTGIGSGNPPATWNVERGENIIWKTEIEGLAHSSPIVAGDKIFLTTAVSRGGDPSLKVGMYGSGDSPNEDVAWTWKVICLDRNSGKIRWRQTAHEGKPKQKRHTKATHANSTPVTDGRFIVAMFGSEGLFCYDVAGKLKWKIDLGVLESGPYNAPSMQWGFAGSPIIHKNQVILQCDVLNGGFIAVLDLESGKEVLRIPRKDVATWSTPVVVETCWATLIVCNGYRHIGAYDLKTGAEIWWLRGGGDVPVPTPFVANDMLYISNAHGGMSPMYAIHTGSRGDITPVPDGPTPSAIAWWHPRRGSYIPTPIVYEGNLYIGNDRGILTCLDAITGREHYRQRIAENRGEAYSASPVAAGGKVYFTSERGWIHVVKAGSKFQLLASNQMDEICMATPAIDKGWLFVRTKNRLYCIGSEAGK